LLGGEALNDKLAVCVKERVKPPDLERKKRVIARETILKQGEQLMAELASSRALLGRYRT
jgi:hypothetical protein